MKTLMYLKMEKLSKVIESGARGPTERSSRSMMLNVSIARGLPPICPGRPGIGTSPATLSYFLVSHNLDYQTIGDHELKGRLQLPP